MQNWLIEYGPMMASIATFLAVLLVAGAVYLVTAGRAQKVERRLSQLRESRGRPLTQDVKPEHDGDFMVRWLEPVGGLILPDDEWQQSALKRQLVFAGHRQPSALYVLLGSKLVAALALPMIVAFGFTLAGNTGFITSTLGLLSIVIISLVGFILPDFVLRRQAQARRDRFIEAFPDALDMLVVCVEAGLGLDAAINRVAKELKLSYPELATEFELNAIEIRAGKSRAEAMRSLAERMDIDQMQSLVSLILQAEKYGTSIGGALRIYSDEMRVERIQRAKEKAATLPNKLLFPVMLFIFPALFLVILGPAIINISASFSGGL